MVSFSCETCGDVLTKKKLDSHKNNCHNAQFTCLDCHSTFKGVQYRQHTTCMTEAQKTQGPLYKPKKTKTEQRKSMTVSKESQALVPRNAFQQEAPSPDNRVALVNAPPRAPSPPPPPKSLPAPGVNVFDFLVTDGKDATSAAATPKPADEWDMSDDDEEWEDTEDLFMELPPDYDKIDEQIYNARRQFSACGYSYGTDPLVPPAPNPMAFLVGTDRDVKTPALARKSQSHSRNMSTDSTTKKSGKRKRSHPEDLDLSRIRGDVVMTDVPVPPLHSGLTGGLQKMMAARPGFPFPPSPDDSNGDGGDAGPQSPLKRSRRAKEEMKERGRSREKRRGREHKTKKSSRRGSEEQRSGRWERRRHRRREESPVKEKEGMGLLGRAMKAIEYHPTGSSVSKKDEPRAHEGNAVILHPTKASSRAETFMSFVEKSAETERGCSVHKALRRYHRERGDKTSKGQEEKELWRDLRLRVNDRGEVVLFVG